MPFSSSRFSGKQASESMDSGRKHGSALAVDSSSKCDEVDMQSSLVKSEISTETHLTPGNGSFEVEMRKTKRLNTMMHDSQYTAESSCSNSSPVAVQFLLSNQSYQESSRETYLFRNCGSSMDSFSSKTFDSSPEEPVTASSESGVSARIATRNGMKVLSMDGNHSSSLMNKGDRETSHDWDNEAATPGDAEVLNKTDGVKCFSRNAFFIDEKNPGAVGKTSFSSDISSNFHCTSRLVKGARVSNGHANHPTFLSGTGRSVSAMKGKLLEMDSNKYKDEFWVIESSDSSMTKCGKKPVKDQDKVVAGFDLNEDINANRPDDCVQTEFASISSHGVIHVVAKAGIPLGRPLKPLKFEGRLGWKGTAGTSAFRPTAPKNLDGKTCSTDHRPKQPESFTGIDLNVDVVEDTAAGNGVSVTAILDERVSSPSTLHRSQEVDRKQARSHWIDLNCQYDAADETTQPFIPPKSESSPLVDLNLDTSVSLRSSNAHWLRNKTSDFSNRGMQDFSLTRSVYLASNAHALMGSPHILQLMEPIQTVAAHTLPPHSYPAKGPFFGSRHPLQSSVNLSGTLPRYQDHGIFLEPLNPSSVHQSYNAPHTARFHHERSSNASALAPKLELKTEDLLPTGGSKIERPKQFPFLSKDLMGEARHQEAWHAASLKRKEPEGRQEGYQLGYKQVN